MCQRSTLHRLVDSLPEEDLTTAGRLLVGLTMTADAVERALLLAPDDDEPETPEERAAVEEALRDLREGRTVPHEEVKRRLGLA
jgi:hypothetical protein